MHSRSTLDSVISGLEPGWVEKKIKEEKTWCDPVDPTRPSYNLLNFFLLKHRYFDFFKKN